MGKHYKGAFSDTTFSRNVKVKESKKKKEEQLRDPKLGREMAIFVRFVVGALLCLGSISARSLSEVLRAADVESAEGIVEALSNYVNQVEDKLAELAAFEARIAANEGFDARIDELEALTSKIEIGAKVAKNEELCCEDVKCQNYRGTLAVTKKGHTCQDWDKDTVQDNSGNDPEDRPGTGLVKNYCRNPDGDSSGPWCYTLTEGERWDNCDIPLCA